MIEVVKKNILVVDDSLVTLSVLQSLLERSYEIYPTKDVKSAEKILHAKPIDLILLDIEMPDMSGMDFLDAIHNNTSFYHIPIIIVSSHGTEDTIVKAKKKGASDFVVKPCNPKTLLEKINSVLKVARKRINHEVLARKLNILETACTMKQASRVKEIITELEQLYCDIAVDIKLTELCKCAESEDYKEMTKKINAILEEL